MNIYKKIYIDYTTDKFFVGNNPNEFTIGLALLSVLFAWIVITLFMPIIAPIYLLGKLHNKIINNG